MYRDRVMRCAACEADLVQYGARSKWRCAQCGAVVIASSELELELGDIGAGLSDVLDTTRLEATARACPACDAGMNQLAIEGIVFERCPQDHMMWFDSGELGKIRAAIASAGDQSVLLRLWEGVGD